jgi:hypothetical protein
MTADAGVSVASRAVLIGVSAYEYAEFPPIRPARNSLEAMRSLLSDPALCGWPAGQITVIANPISAAGLAADLADLAERTTGALLLYYVGHGMLSARGELCLTVTSTHPDRPRISGLPWDTVAAVLRRCPAEPRLAILDCCFDGEAIGALSGEGAGGLAGKAQVEGVYTLMGTTTRDRAAQVPSPTEQETTCTSFTGELRDLIRRGIPGQAPRLALSDLYPALRQRLLARGLPIPSQSGTDAARQFTFTANAAVPAGPQARTMPANGDRAAAPNNVAAQNGLATPTGPAAQNGLGAPKPDGPEPVRPGSSRHNLVVADALRAARSIAEEESEARALAAIAASLAGADPGRAARLAADAERIAQSIPDPDKKASALAVVVGPLASSDADRAEAAARSIPQAAWKASALAAVGEALAAAHPERGARLIADAERIAEAIPDPDRKASALAAVVEAQAGHDPDRAERLARSITGPGVRAAALAAVASAVAVTDADRAARLIADAGRIARAISGASLRAPALAAVAKAQAAIDPPGAARLVADAERSAQLVPDAARKAPALAAVAEALSVTDPDHAERVARSITDGSCGARALAAVAKALADRDPAGR